VYIKSKITGIVFVAWRALSVSQKGIKRITTVYGGKRLIHIFMKINKAFYLVSFLNQEKDHEEKSKMIYY